MESHELGSRGYPGIGGEYLLQIGGFKTVLLTAFLDER
jgi:hypothetical protein